MAASRPVIRDATRADLKAFYKATPAQTMIARVGVVRGRIVGCGGVAFVDGMPIVFCDLKPSARRYKVTIVKAALEVINAVRARGCRVMWAKIDPNEPGATRWCASLGFEPTQKPGLSRWLASRQ